MSQPKTADTLELLVEAGRLLSSKLDVGDVLREVLKLATRLVSAQTASLLLYDETSRELYFDVALGLAPELLNLRFKIGEGIAGIVALGRKPFVVDDVSQTTLWTPRVDHQSGFTTRSMLAVPMLVKDRLVGVLEAINKEEGAFSPSDVAALESLAMQAAIAIENARLFARLREEKSKLDSIFKEMADGAILADEKGCILLANPAAVRLTQGSASPLETLDQVFDGFEADPPLRDLTDSSVPHALDFTAKRCRPKNLVLAGKALRVELAAKRASIDGPVEAARLLIFRDETEKAREDRLKRTFLSLISHKLKTPLTSILGYAEILSDEESAARGADPETRARMLHKAAVAIVSQSKYLSSLVDRLLLYVSLEDPLRHSEMEIFPLEEAVRQTLQGLADWLKAQNARVVEDMAGESPILGNRNFMRAAIKNLVENALKFNANPAKKILLRLSREDGFAILSVQDNGPGIPPEEQERIFSRFYQVEPSFTGQTEGWGLGLPLAQRVARWHGGRLNLTSRLGTGTTVTLALPLAGSHDHAR
jgi:signal transduction histidine kinase